MIFKRRIFLIETLEKSRPMLTIKEQIEHLKSKGVKFELINEDDSESYLSYNNNYFKIRAYRKNFPKRQAGERADTYIDLDFAMLKDLSAIDVKLKSVLLLMALDIEHFEKVKLLRFVSESEDDGYNIVSEYLLSLKAAEEDSENNYSPYSALMTEINRNKENEYLGGIIKKYNGNYPIWAFVEIIPFGSFISFVKFCGEYLGNKKLIDDFYLLRDVKRLRNAAAHNSCIIYNLLPNTAKHKSNYNVLRFFRKPEFCLSKAVMDGRMSNAAIRDIATLIYAHTAIVTSSETKKKQAALLKETVSRCYKHIDYYVSNDVIKTSFDFLKKIVDKAYEV